MRISLLTGHLVFRFPLAATLPLLLALFLALSLLTTLSTTARAACLDASAVGQTIKCDEDRTDGWSHGGNDDLTVTVEATEDGVTLTNETVGSGAVMTLDDETQSTLINLGTIQADSDDQNAIEVGDLSFIHNKKEILDEGDNLEDPADDIVVEGVINVYGSGTSTDIIAGIKGNDNTDIFNEGTINAGDADASDSEYVDGINVHDVNSVANTGTINVNGTNSAGIRANINNNITGFTIDETTGVLDPDITSLGNLLNEGTIEVNGANSYGIKANNNNYIENGSNDQEGTINVSGSGSYGIHVEGAPYREDGVDDEGNKILTIDYGNTVLNSSTGIISVTGDGAIGIHFGDRNGTPEIRGPDPDSDATNILLREQGSGGIQNDGAITVNAVTGSQAAGLEGGSRNTVYNFGTITVEAGSDGDAIRLQDDNVVWNWQGTDDPDTEDIVEQPGVILVKGNGDGIVFTNDDDPLTDDRGNELDNQGTITTQSGTAVIFAAPSDENENKLTNSGTIESLAGGFAIEGSDGTESITNTGIITGNVNLGAGADDFTYQYTEVLDEDDETPIFQSSIDGDVNLGSGDDLFSLSSTPTGITGVIDGGAGDTDTLELRGIGEFDLAGFDGTGPVTWQNFEEVNIGREGDFVWLGDSIETRVGYSPVTGSSQAGIWVLSNTGNSATSITNFNFISGTLQAADPDVRIDVQGSTTFGEGSVYISELRDADGDSTWLSFEDAVVVIEQGDAPSGAELQVVFANDEALSLAPGDTNAYTYTVLTSEAGFNGTFPVFEHPDTPLFNFEAPEESQYVGTNAVLTVKVTRNTFESLGGNHNQRRVGQQLDEIQAYTDEPPLPPGWDAVFIAIASQDLKGVQSAYDQLSPEPYDAHTSLALASGLLFTRGLLERPLDCKRRTHHSLENRLTSRAVCDGEGRWEPWFIAFGQHQERDSDTLEFEGDVSGIMTGISKRFTDDFSMAFGIGAATGDAELDTTQGRTEYDGAFAGFSAALDRGPWRYKSAATYSHGSHDMKRRIQFTVPDYLNKSDNDSDGGTLLVEASYGMLSKNGWEIRPSVGLDYAYLTEDALKETEGATGSLLNLDLDERKNSVAAGSIGLRLSKSTPRYRYIIADSLTDGIWTSDFSVRARGVFTGYEHDLESRYQGAPSIRPVKVTSEDSRIMGEIGAGITFQPKDSNSTLGVEYHAALGDEGSSQTIQGNYRMGLNQKFVIGKLEPLLFGRQYKYGFAKY